MPSLKDKNLCSSFRRLNITLEEANLTSRINGVKPVQSLVPFSLIKENEERRLPSLLQLPIIMPSIQERVLEIGNPIPVTIIEKVEPLIQPAIEENPKEPVIEKQAARLIKIRRRKMRKHKLKKLRKKMKFVWLKRIQKREYAKEKAFQAEQMGHIRAAEAFNAQEYVADVLRRVHEKPTPRMWKGNILPPGIVRQEMEKAKAKRERREYWSKWIS